MLRFQPTLCKLLRCVPPDASNCSLAKHECSLAFQWRAHGAMQHGRSLVGELANSMSQLAHQWKQNSAPSERGVSQNALDAIPFRVYSCALQALGDISPRTRTHVSPGICTGICTGTRSCVCLLSGDARPC